MPATLVVTCAVDDSGKAAIAEAIAGAAEIVYLTEVEAGSRAAVLGAADALLARNSGTELRPDELALIRGARLLQFVTAGVDYIPLRDLPPELPLACNGGGYAEPMAEHALAMALAAAKRLLVEHGNLARGRFDQFAPNRMLAGGVCGVLGFGGIGVATARLMRGLGMRIHAINRRGVSAEPADWIGTPDRLDMLLAASDLLIISLPLTVSSRGMIDARALSRMKPDAILINLARGEIVDEAALYEHLTSHPRFFAGIDAWWVEPIRHGAFRMDRPFLTLSNVIGSPHNSASVAGWRDVALGRAAANCRRVLRGEAPLHLVGPDERVS